MFCASSKSPVPGPCSQIHVGTHQEKKKTHMIIQVLIKRVVEFKKKIKSNVLSGVGAFGVRLWQNKKSNTFGHTKKKQ